MKMFRKCAALLLTVLTFAAALGAPWQVSAAAAAYSWDEDTRTITVHRNVSGQFGDGVDTFPWAAQRNKVQKVIFDDAVTAVYDRAFSSCPELETVITGRNTRTIGMDAFAYGPCLSSIVFSCPVTSIGQGTVYGTELWYVTLTDQTKEEFLAVAAKKPYNDAYGDEFVTYTIRHETAFSVSEDCLTVILDVSQDAASDYPWYGERSAVRRLYVDEGVTLLGAHAFDGFANLEEVFLPSTLKVISSYAFANCPRLSRLRFDAPLKTLGEGAFLGSDALSLVVLEGQTESAFRTVASSKMYNLASNGGVSTGLDSAAYFTVNTGGRWANVDDLTEEGAAMKNCDVNKNGTVSIEDVTALLNYLSDPRASWAGVYYDVTSDGVTSINDVTLLLNVLSYGCRHVLSVCERTEATCSAPGNRRYYRCQRCGEALTVCHEIAQKAHTPVTEHRLRPTCVSDGHTKEVRCAVCDQILLPRTTLPATGVHVPVDDPATSADCTRDGLSAGSHCALCGVVLTPREVVEENFGGHSFVDGFCTKCGLSEEDAALPPYIPANGVLTPLADGQAPGLPDGCNPAIIDGKLSVFFDFAFQNVGLDLGADTAVDYVVTKNGETISGRAALDTSDARFRCDAGYIGVLLPVRGDYALGDDLSVSVSFTDLNGKSFVCNTSLRVSLPMRGVDIDLFVDLFDDEIETVIDGSNVIQSGSVAGRPFRFTIRLDKWAENTSPDRIALCARLFWQVYPRMFARFGEKGNSPTSVSLAIENEGYGIASASGNAVHIHDNWLKEHPQDIDCLTHEFAHVIQNGWNGRYLEDSNFIEQFADACRYLYAFENGLYNDVGWSVATIRGQSTRSSAVRFHLWYDYFYSTPGNDLLLKFFDVCRNGRIRSGSWQSAWAQIFRGSALEGMSADEIFEAYKNSDFARLSTAAQPGSVSKLQQAYNVRGAAQRSGAGS